MRMRFLVSLLLVGLLNGLSITPAVAQQPVADSGQTLLHMLDYLGVDYAGAVDKGVVVSAAEYAEMQEFSAQAIQLLKGMPAQPRHDALLAQAQALAQLVASKAAATEVAAAATRLKWDTITAYGIAVSPKQAPSLAAAPQLFQQYCAGCHGTSGRGDGPAGKGLDPAPANFYDHERMAQRSIYGLYNTITLGVNGTSMVAFQQLTEEDRWALAFYVADLGAEAAARSQGAALWQAGADKAAFADLRNLVTLAPNEILTRFGDDAVQVQTYLRAHPETLVANKTSPLDFAIAAVGDSATAYKNGDRAGAQKLAVQAYLEGFELVENSLQNIDASLMKVTERQMMALRELMRSAAPVDTVTQQANQVQSLLIQSKEALSGTAMSATTIFFSSLLILLREGIEAILVVGAVIAFLVKTNRRDALPYVHTGWIAAVVLGIITWGIATWVIDISGANREITEGVTALVAAGMLVYVGYWLHSKSSARAWQGFIKEQVGSALAKRTLWAMSLIAFLAVYREMFETVLFYQALWVQAGVSGRSAVLGGIGAAAAMLAVVAWGIFKYSVRLPLKPFFTFTSILLCALAFVLTGKGIIALQEAGKIASEFVNFPTVPLLGIAPTLQSLGAQAIVLLIVIAAFWFSTRNERKATAA